MTLGMGRRFSILVGALVVGAVLAAPGEAQQKVSLVFSAGPTGGSGTPMAAATAEVIKKKFPELDVQVEPGAVLLVGTLVYGVLPLLHEVAGRSTVSCGPDRGPSE